MRNETIRTMPDGRTMLTVAYKPNGIDHALQKDITELLHYVCMNAGVCTLAELGYMHLSTLQYNQDTKQPELKVYFDPRFACRPVDTDYGREIIPVNEFNIFENYLFVGDVRNVITFDKLLVPEGKVVEDEKGRSSLVIKDDAKLVKMKVMAINCNLAITVAAMYGVNLGSDDLFSVKCQTVGKSGKNPEQTIIINGNMRTIPISLTATLTEPGEGYEPSLAIPYLMGKKNNMEKAEDNTRKLEQKAHTESEKKRKAKEAKKDKGFAKYS